MLAFPLREGFTFLPHGICGAEGTLVGRFLCARPLLRKRRPWFLKESVPQAAIP